MNDSRQARRETLAGGAKGLPRPRNLRTAGAWAAQPYIIP
jgi:hypothetical protein